MSLAQMRAATQASHQRYEALERKRIDDIMSQVAESQYAAAEALPPQDTWSVDVGVMTAEFRAQLTQRLGSYDICEDDYTPPTLRLRMMTSTTAQSRAMCDAESDEKTGVSSSHPDAAVNTSVAPMTETACAPVIKEPTSPLASSHVNAADASTSAAVSTMVDTQTTETTATSTTTTRNLPSMTELIALAKMIHAEENVAPFTMRMLSYALANPSQRCIFPVSSLVWDVARWDACILFAHVWSYYEDVIVVPEHDWLAGRAANLMRRLFAGNSAHHHTVYIMGEHRVAEFGSEPTSGAAQLVLMTRPPTCLERDTIDHLSKTHTVFQLQLTD
jgi:hypothetical protein